MPRLFVVDDETKNLKKLSAALLRAQLTKPQEMEALADLETLNPGLDLSRLRSGEVLAIPDSPAFKRSASEPLRKGSFEAFADLTRASLDALTVETKAERADRQVERDEVGRALKLAQKQEPRLKAELARVAKSLKREEQEDEDDEKQLAASVKAGLAELAELSERHFR
jgi:hypothetical protein